MVKSLIINIMVGVFVHLKNLGHMTVTGNSEKEMVLGNMKIQII